MSQARGRSSYAGAERVATCGGPALEELSGGNWMARYTDRWRLQRCRLLSGVERSSERSY
jgi:hypothetical protein